jgi:hypothetical protein
MIMSCKSLIKIFVFLVVVFFNCAIATTNQDKTNQDKGLFWVNATIPDKSISDEYHNVCELAEHTSLFEKLEGPESTEEARDEKIPVIFVHGWQTLGNRISYSSRFANPDFDKNPAGKSSFNAGVRVRELAYNAGVTVRNSIMDFLGIKSHKNLENLRLEYKDVEAYFSPHICTWWTFLDALDAFSMGDNYFNSKFTFYTFGYDSDDAIENNGEKFLSVLQMRFKNKKVFVIAHSMGGLVADYAMNSPGGDIIDKLITIATPFYGTSALLCLHKNEADSSCSVTYVQPSAIALFNIDQILSLAVTDKQGTRDLTWRSPLSLKLSKNFGQLKSIASIAASESSKDPKSFLSLLSTMENPTEIVVSSIVGATNIALDSVESIANPFLEKLDNMQHRDKKDYYLYCAQNNKIPAKFVENISDQPNDMIVPVRSALRAINYNDVQSAIETPYPHDDCVQDRDHNSILEDTDFADRVFRKLSEFAHQTSDQNIKLPSKKEPADVSALTPSAISVILNHSSYGFSIAGERKYVKIPQLLNQYEQALENTYGRILYTDCLPVESKGKLILDTQMWLISEGYFTQSGTLEQLYGFGSCQLMGSRLYGVGVYRSGKLVSGLTIDLPNLLSVAGDFMVVPNIKKDGLNILATMVESNKGFDFGLFLLKDAKPKSIYFRDIVQNIAPSAWGRDGMPPNSSDVAIRSDGKNIQVEVTPFKMTSYTAFKRLGPPAILPSQNGQLKIRTLVIGGKAPTPPSSSNSSGQKPTDFVPIGYKLVFSKQADLNMDGQLDWVIVLEDQREGENYGQRILKILTREGTGYRIAAVNKNDVQVLGGGGVQETPVDIAVGKGWLGWSNASGSGPSGARTDFRFEYDSKARQWFKCV